MQAYAKKRYQQFAMAQEKNPSFHGSAASQRMRKGLRSAHDKLREHGITGQIFKRDSSVPEGISKSMAADYGRRQRRPRVAAPNMQNQWRPGWGRSRPAPSVPKTKGGLPSYIAPLAAGALAAGATGFATHKAIGAMRAMRALRAAQTEDKKNDD